MQRNKLLSVTNLAFIALEMLYWFLILFKAPNVNQICFLSIVTAFCYSLTGFSVKKKSFLIPLGLLFTCSADFCLVICNPPQTLLSLVFFSFVQIFYAIQIIKDLSKSGKKISVKGIILARVLVSVIFTVAPVIVLGSSADLVSVITLFYFSNLIMNLVCCFFDVKRNLSLIIGLICFICCDILVGLGYADGVYFTIPKESLIYSILHSGVNLIWLFYIPSQTIISLFAQKVKKSV